MTNSTIMCQIYVASALKPLREAYQQIHCLHYMDNILLAAQDRQNLLDAYASLAILLQKRGLIVAPDKVQNADIMSYLGSRILPDVITPQKIQLRLDSLHTLNDFQKLLGNIGFGAAYICPMMNYDPFLRCLKGIPLWIPPEP